MQKSGRRALQGEGPATAKNLSAYMLAVSKIREGGVATVVGDR